MAATEIPVPHPAAEAEEIYRRWIRFLDEEFLRHCSAERRSEIVRDQLTQIYLGRPHGGKLNLTLTSELPGNVVNLSLDPMNVTLEAEHFPEVDRERFARRKPLLWFWQMFDRSPIGLNHWLGLRFRCMLGRHIFEHLGAGVKIYHGVEFTFGYNLTLEDDVIIHNHVLLDDRGELIIRKGSSISDYAAVFSHAHDPVEACIIEHRRTEVGPNARVTYRSLVMPGVRVGQDSMLGAQAVATHDLEPNSIVGGIPGRKIMSKRDAHRLGEKDGDGPCEELPPND